MAVFFIITLAALVLVNGYTDAPCSIAAAVGVGALKLKTALWGAALFNVLGVAAGTFLWGDVAKRVVNLSGLQGLPQRTALFGLCIAMLSAVIWGSLAARFGLPTSESHGILAGLTGAALALGGNPNLMEWGAVALGLIISLTAPLILSYVITAALSTLFLRLNKQKSTPIFNCANSSLAMLSAFLHGWQDGQKFTALLQLSLAASLFNGLAPVIFVGLTMGLGTALGGAKIIKTLGVEMVRLEPFSALCGEISGAVCLWGLTAFGLPVSTTHLKTVSLMGAARCMGKSHINTAVIRSLMAAWLLTFPLCGGISYILSLIYIIF